MNENLLEISEYNGVGYRPLVDFGAWRVAILRHDEIKPDGIDQVERHNQTDEVFVLFTGRAILFIAEGESEPTRINPQVMEMGKLYNVKCHAWHTVVLSPDASILLVENCDTGQANTDYAALSAPLRQVIVETSLREQPDCWGTNPIHP